MLSNVMGLEVVTTEWALDSYINLIHRGQYVFRGKL